LDELRKSILVAARSYVSIARDFVYGD